MSGAVIGGVAALLGFGGLWAYLLYVNHRLSHALAELAATGREAAPPEVLVTEVEATDGTV